ncbi:MAG: hypothetical protein R3B13_18125 [Polyangiaceae bacterium]
MRRRLPWLALLVVLLALACTESGQEADRPSSGGDAATATGGAAGSTSGGTGGAAVGGSGGTADAGDDGTAGGSAGAAPVDDLASNRQRLLDSYFSFLKASVTVPQSNGLSGQDVSSSCELWQKLDPSARAVFLTLTARMQGSRLGSDQSSTLVHVMRVYRIAGGKGASPTDPGSCGGGEFNRMILAMDATLQAALLAAHEHKGASQTGGKPDVADIPADKPWRDSHDLAGPHAPFDRSSETEAAAPRAQAHFFADPKSLVANTPLGRQDLQTLVEPLALELDQDYDCIHDSNPLCSYVTYGPLCLPQPSLVGTVLFENNYGAFDASWAPSCLGQP